MEVKEIKKEQLAPEIEKFIDIIGYAIDFELVWLEEPGLYRVDMQGENLGGLIGFHGKNISSIEYVINLILSQKYGIGKYITIDINGYRKNRLDVIKKYVESTIIKVRKTKLSEDLYPMNPYERSFVHNLLKEEDDLETLSSGEEPHRYITIHYKG